ncbi:protein kinase subdomain-containing protein PKL/ccin4 [Coprinopsis cinerea okayama7|uniref:Protein kinase subdomain-containing protein PKL/ccin4 n=1 Tax=Coprinopsis cinerea (strain Okayama-7 / 130 / ATCC MYA-4618 / FGSC 9003) TaxID=240176 RepID=A8P686_COPC7|nr:protein kinase subdomain-containing protein PKL/ccin4 [Coprinopsis cinerea okayama7\|eukprot:XP_001839102.2 protein kinase subdomain-containing protein PKL/ccin4 [Coprinopsis cinerea okayama7\
MQHPESPRHRIFSHFDDLVDAVKPFVRALAVRDEENVNLFPPHVTATAVSSIEDGRPFEFSRMNFIPTWFKDQVMQTMESMEKSDTDLDDFAEMRFNLVALPDLREMAKWNLYPPGKNPGQSKNDFVHLLKEITYAIATFVALLNPKLRTRPPPSILHDWEKPDLSFHLYGTMLCFINVRIPPARATDTFLEMVRHLEHPADRTSVPIPAVKMVIEMMGHLLQDPECSEGIITNGVFDSIYMKIDRNTEPKQIRFIHVQCPEPLKEGGYLEWLCMLIYFCGHTAFKTPFGEQKNIVKGVEMINLFEPLPLTPVSPSTSSSRAGGFILSDVILRLNSLSCTANECFLNTVLTYVPRLTSTFHHHILVGHRPGPDSRQAVLLRSRNKCFVIKIYHHVADFETESQALTKLGRLSCSPKLLASGLTSQSHYFVLLTYTGQTLQEFTDQQIEDVKEKIKLLHAHGVHHHDILPQNTTVDTRGRLRLIDFGESDFDCRYGEFCPDISWEAKWREYLADKANNKIAKPSDESSEQVTPSST